MAKKNRTLRYKSKKKQTQKSSSYEKNGFVFAFDDEHLQDQYISQYDFYNNELGGKGNLPIPSKISYAVATSLVRGKNKKELDEILDVYRQNDYSWQSKGSLHKMSLMNEVQKDTDGAKQLSKYVKKMNKLFKKLELATDVENIKGENRVRYHMVYYSEKVNG